MTRFIATNSVSLMLLPQRLIGQTQKPEYCYLMTANQQVRKMTKKPQELRIQYIKRNYISGVALQMHT